MKTKRVIALILAAAMCFTLAACNSNGEFLTPKQASKYVTSLGTYKGLTIDLTTEENIESINETLKETSTGDTKITDRAVQDGDTVNIDYEGTRLDTNVVFAGGTASGYDLEIGSGSFIDGFEEGLIGVTPGTTVDLNLSFPKDYSVNASLAGVAVVFKVKVNYIHGYSEEDVKRAEDSVAASLILQELLNTTTFTTTMPEKQLNSQIDELMAEVESGASMAGMDLDTYLLSYFQMTEDEVRSQAVTYATSMIKQEIVYLTVAFKEGIELTDDEYETQVNEQAVKYGYDGRIDEFIEAYGGEEDIRSALLLMEISDYILSKNTIIR